MDLQLDVLARLLRELTGLEQIYLRNDLSVRRNDGLELSHGFLDVPFPTVVPIQEHGLTFEVDLAGGHKTGFYLDQTDNHLALHTLVPAGGTVLDAFCYTGALVCMPLPLVLEKYWGWTARPRSWRWRSRMPRAMVSASVAGLKPVMSLTASASSRGAVSSLI